MISCSTPKAFHKYLSPDLLWIYKTLFIFFFFLNQIPSLQARDISLRISLPDKIFVLDRNTLVKRWKTLNQREKRIAVAYLLEYGVQHKTTRKKIISLLQSSRDQILRAYSYVARAFFTTADSRKQLLLLRSYRRVRRYSAHRYIIDFYRAFLLQKINGRVYSQGFRNICRVPGQGRLCLLAGFILEVERTTVLKADRVESGIRRILQIGNPFLSGTFSRPPFYENIVSSVIPELYSLALPLEAAIIANQVARPRGDKLNYQVPYYLGAAADFKSALKYIEKYKTNKNTVLLNARLDLQMLGGKYRDAIRSIIKTGPNKYIDSRMRKHFDYWTSFRFGAEVIRFRLAFLFFLVGDIKKAVSALEHIASTNRELFNGEPVRYFARLRIAQFLLGENPKLAQKISENLTYMAQEKDWQLLEYRATIINGWANYFLGKNYKALINFVKARGILAMKNKKYKMEYLRLMGILAARNRMNPRGNHSRLIRRVYNLLNEKTYGEARYLIREWMPRGVGPDFFMKEALTNQNSRNDLWASLNLLLERRENNEFLFQHGNNPGGLRGVTMSRHWSREMEGFHYLTHSLPDKGRILPAVIGYAKKYQSGAKLRELKPSSFRTPDIFLFSFRIKSGRKYFLVHPQIKRIKYYVRKKRKRYRRTRKIKTRAITTLFINEKQATRLKYACAMPGSYKCRRFKNIFRPLRRKIKRYSGKKSILRIQYNPEFDINYGLLFKGFKKREKIIYFYSTNKSMHLRRKRRKGLIYSGRKCQNRLTRKLKAEPADFIRFFRDDKAATKTAAIWVWPTRFDGRNRRSGNRGPAYLRKFYCGPAKLRLWEMDRLSGARALGLLIFYRRSGENKLNRTFARHFAENGTILLELFARGALEKTEEIIRPFLKKNGKEGYRKFYAKDVLKNYLARASFDNSLRFIIPGIFDKF